MDEGTRRMAVVGLALAAVAGAGCTPPPGVAARPGAPAAASRAPEGPNADAAIGAVVIALDNTDISYAKLAPSRASSEDVKAFAKRMITDHTAVSDQVSQLLAKADLVPVDNETSLDLRDESASNRDILRELSGRAFDSTYIDNEVRYHKKFLTILDRTVGTPGARGPSTALRNLLVTLRPAVQSHLQHAELIQSAYVKKGGK